MLLQKSQGKHSNTLNLPRLKLTTNSRHPYAPGTSHEILLFTAAEEVSSINKITIIATVIKAFEPFTISPVLYVSLQPTHPGAHPSEAILKLYDRRFATDIRGYYNANEWTASKESAYLEFKAQDSALLSRDDPDFDSEVMSDGEREAFIEKMCQLYYGSEVRAYRRLHDLQGVQIPKFYGTVILKDVGGILIEYIPSFRLREIKEHLPKETWDAIGNGAVALVNLISDRGVLNSDVRLENILVTTTDPPRVVMIDFGLTRLRREDEGDEEWRRAKKSQDEEGAVGYVFEKYSGGKFKYKPSHRYRVFHEGEDSD